MLRPLPKKNQDNNELDFKQGLAFGLGFMTAVFLFSTIIVPAIFCGIWLLFLQG